MLQGDRCFVKMKWIELDLARIVDIERQVEEVCRTYEMLCNQAEKQRTTNVAQILKAAEVLRKSISERVTSMEQFYRDNDLDHRAARIEQCRIRLKRLLLTRSKAAETPHIDTQTAQQSSIEQRVGHSARNGSAPSNAATGNTNTSNATLANSSTPGTEPIRVASANEKVLVRLVMTMEEFEELQLRRQAMQHYLTSMK